MVGDNCRSLCLHHIDWWREQRKTSTLTRLLVYSMANYCKCQSVCSFSRRPNEQLKLSQMCLEVICYLSNQTLETMWLSSERKHFLLGLQLERMLCNNAANFFKNAFTNDV